jgi:FkbM family methyltransferase
MSRVTVKRLIYGSLLTLVRLLGPRALRGRLATRLRWDTAQRSSLLLVDGAEIFVVAAGDQTIGREVFLKGQPFDFDKFELVARLLRQRTLLVDVGANIGTICIPAVRRGLFERAIAIEPEPLNFSLLSANIHLNRLGNQIEAHQTALGAKDGESLSFVLSADNFGDHRASAVQIQGATTVPSNTFDSVVGALPPGSLIWMDTQGFEGFVLAGALRALEDLPPLVIEFCPQFIARTDALDLLKTALARYPTFYDLNASALEPKAFTPEVLDAIYSKLGQDGSYTDLLFMPSGAASQA